MRKLTTVEELRDFRRRIIDDMGVQYDIPTLVVCAGTGGQASGSNGLHFCTVHPVSSYRYHHACNLVPGQFMS